MTQRVSFCRFRGARVAPDDRAGRWGATRSGSRARPVVRARSLLRAHPHATTDIRVARIHMAPRGTVQTRGRRVPPPPRRGVSPGVMII